MSASSPCRLGLEQPRLAWMAAAVLVPPPLLASLCASLPWPLRVLVAVCSVAALAHELWQWAQWRALVIAAPDRLVLHHRDGREVEAAWCSQRRVGPLLVLCWQAQGRPQRLLLWLPGLGAEPRRRLLRQLPRMSGSSV